MLTGLFAGICWALETVVLGYALGMSPFVSTPQAILLAPFVSTFLHDLFSAMFMLLLTLIRGEFGRFAASLRDPGLKWLILASAVGGPMGMSGYVLAVRYMGSAIGAVASAVYPAVGTVLACIFLREKVQWYQWIFLMLTLSGVYGLSFSSSIVIENFWLGLIGAAMCAFGWGIEAVILSKCFRSSALRNDFALTVRQSVSALIYGILILPCLGGWGFTAELAAERNFTLFGIIAIAGIFAAVSYLFYYKAIEKNGAARAMALNITYTAWAILFTVLFYRDLSILSPQTMICAAIVVICGILAASDLQSFTARSTAKKL